MCEIRESGGWAGDAAWPGPWIGASMMRPIPVPLRWTRSRLDPCVTCSCPKPVPTVQEGSVTMSRAWRTIVVDDNPTLLKFAVRLLASIPDVVVVGEANSGQSALEVVDRMRPDLVLTDLAMPGMDGLELTRTLVARPDGPAVIIMTVHDLPQYRDAALAAGTPPVCRQIRPLQAVAFGDRKPVARLSSWRRGDGRVRGAGPPGSAFRYALTDPRGPSIRRGGDSRLFICRENFDVEVDGDERSGLVQGYFRQAVNADPASEPSGRSTCRHRR